MTAMGCSRSRRSSCWMLGAAAWSRWPVNAMIVQPSRVDCWICTARSLGGGPLIRGWLA
jgi:hypothetical protein